MEKGPGLLEKGELADKRGEEEGSRVIGEGRRYKG